MNVFGIDLIAPFAPPPPQVVQKQPEQAGKGGEDWLSTILNIGSLIPGPQQPFVLGAAALNGVVQGGIKGNPMQAAGGISQIAGLPFLKDLMGGAGKILPGASGSLTGAATGALTGAQDALSIPSFGGYGFQFNPYQTSSYPFFGGR